MLTQGTEATSEEMNSMVALIQGVILLWPPAVGEALDAEVVAIGVVRWRGNQAWFASAIRSCPSRSLSSAMGRESRDLADYVRTDASSVGNGCCLVLDGAGGPNLSVVRASCLQCLPPLHSGQHPPPAEAL